METCISIDPLCISDTLCKYSSGQIVLIQMASLAVVTGFDKFPYSGFGISPDFELLNIKVFFLDYLVNSLSIALDPRK